MPKQINLTQFAQVWKDRRIGLGSLEGMQQFLSPIATTAGFADPDNLLNTQDKFLGKPAYDTDTALPVWASGPDPGDSWDGAGGGGGSAPWLQAIDGGNAASTFPGVPTTFPGPFFGVSATDPGPVTITTTIIDSSVFSPQTPIALATDGAGNWVVVTSSQHIWISSDPANTWVEATTVPASSTSIQSVAVDPATGTWCAMSVGNNTVLTSTDNGDTWTEQRDDNTLNANGVATVFWSPSGNTFFTDGQNQSYQSADGTLPWSVESNGSSFITSNFLIADGDVYTVGHSGAGNPRNGSSVNVTAWSMDNDFPATGDFNGVPAGPADRNGQFVVIVPATPEDHRYWYSTDNNTPWSSGTDLRYDLTKTDDILIVAYIAAQDLWYIITDVGDVYTSSDPTGGSSSWTEITSGGIEGNIPLTFQDWDVGSEAWIFINSGNDLVVNEFA